MGFFGRIIPAAVYGVEFHLARYKQRYGIILACFIILGATGWYLVQPPRTLSAPEIVVISYGMPAKEAAAVLAHDGIIRHPRLFSLALSAIGAPIQAGAYRFTEPETMTTVLKRLVSGSFGIAPVRITFTEGETVRDMAERVRLALPSVATSTFIARATPYEGYVFPDTYVFLPYVDTADSIIADMRATFNARVAPLMPAIAASGHSLSDIVTMASLIEREANTAADRRLVSGILWNRIARGMPLQVDAVFGFIHGEDAYAPTLSDLKSDSPYNTYTHTGLPPGPIDNPGLDSIEAALYPASTTYLYYLTGTDGRMYYANTYAEHLQNEKWHLRR